MKPASKPADHAAPARRRLHTCAAGLLATALVAMAPPELSAKPAPPLAEATPDLIETRMNVPAVADVVSNDASVGEGRRLVSILPGAVGKVRRVNGLVEYTPSPGFQGTDTFRYLVQAEGQQPAVGSVTVIVGPPPTTVSFTGRVVDEPVPGANVTVEVDGQTFTTVADQNGYYTIEIAADDLGSVVTATATYPDNPSLQLVSLIGTLAQLAEGDTDGDGFVTVLENNQLNITNFSTAQFVLMTEANGGAIANGEELAAATTAISLDTLVELAAIIKLVVDEGVPLPENTSLIELITTPAAVEEFTASLEPGQLEQTIQTITDPATNPEVLPSYATLGVPAAYTFGLPSAVGSIRVGQFGATAVSFNQDGTGELISERARPDPGIDWSVGPDGSILARLASPLSYDYTIGYINCPAPGQANVWITERITVTAVRYTLVQRTPGIDFVRREWAETAFSYPDGEAPAGCQRRDGRTESETPPPGMIPGFKPVFGEIPFTTAEVFDPIALQHYDGGEYQGIYVENPWANSIHLLEPGGTGLRKRWVPGTPLSDVAITWEIVDGRLVVREPATGFQFTYRRLQRDGRGGEGLFVIGESQGTGKVGDFFMSARQDPAFSFTAPGLAQEWTSGFYLSQPPSDASLPIFGVNLCGAPLDPAFDGSGAQTNGVPFSWEVSDANGEMIASYFRSNSAWNTAYCDATQDGCFLRRTRAWFPLSASGNRIYVMERLRDMDQNGNTVGFSSRPNFYESNACPVGG